VLQVMLSVTSLMQLLRTMVFRKGTGFILKGNNESVIFKDSTVAEEIIVVVTSLWSRDGDVSFLQLLIARKQMKSR